MGAHRLRFELLATPAAAKEAENGLGGLLGGFLDLLLHLRLRQVSRHLLQVVG